MVKFPSKTLKAYKRYFIPLILLVGLFSWRQLSLITINSYLLDSTNHIRRTFLYGIHYISIIITVLMSAISPKRFQNFYIRLWNVPAIVISAFMLIFNRITVTEIDVIYSIISGASFGLGLPICLAYFAESTTTQNRGRVGAIIFFLISLLFAILGTAAETLNLQTFLFLSIIWICSLSIVPWKTRINKLSAGGEIRLKSVISSRLFLLYFVSWGIYCLIDSLAAPLLQDFLDKTFGVEFRNFVLLLATFFTAFSILLAGFLIDFYGRRKMLLYGFIALGMAYATVSIAPYNVIFWYLYSIIDGIATGFFVVILFFTIWGDLSPQGASEKYYAIGGLPYSSLILIREIISPYVILIPVTAAFSFASFFLFLAVIPLMYAPETLPEKEIRRRELRKYIEKAKKIREKYVKES